MTRLLLTPWCWVGTWASGKLGSASLSWQPGALCPLETPPALRGLWAALGWARERGQRRGVSVASGVTPGSACVIGVCSESWGLGLLPTVPTPPPTAQSRGPSPGRGTS